MFGVLIYKYTKYTCLFLPGWSALQWNGSNSFKHLPEGRGSQEGGTTGRCSHLLTAFSSIPSSLWVQRTKKGMPCKAILGTRCELAPPAKKTVKGFQTIGFPVEMVRKGALRSFPQQLFYIAALGAPTLRRAWTVKQMAGHGLPVIGRPQEKGACQYSSVVALHNGKGRQPVNLK